MPKRMTHRLLLAGLAGMLPMLGAGCTVSVTHNPAPKGDPLFGVFPGSDSPPVPPPTTAASATPLPLTPSMANGAPASLASQSGSRPLAIPDATTASQYSAAPMSNWSLAPNPTPKVLPVPSDPAPLNTSTGSIGSTAWMAPGASTATPDAQALAPVGPSSAQMEARLKERGVVGQKKDSVPGGLQLTCYVARSDNPSAYRVMNVTAPNYVAAAEAILQQLGH